MGALKFFEYYMNLPCHIGLSCACKTNTGILIVTKRNYPVVN